jgi:tetratricopeptide (TPR) repeat protein
MRRNPLSAASLLLLAVLVAGPARADGDVIPPPQVAADPDFQAGRKAIDGRNWAEAIDRLGRAAARDPKSADIQNLLGYAYRNQGNLDAAFRHYQEALRLDPKHLGAHEYIGEAWLMAGNLPKAEEHLKALDRLCLLPCDQYKDLKRKVAEYKAGKRP